MCDQCGLILRYTVVSIDLRQMEKYWHFKSFPQNSFSNKVIDMEINNHHNNIHTTIMECRIFHCLAKS